MQVVFRYNNSTLEQIKEDLNLAEVPARGVEIFDVSLVTVRDTTPADASDNTDDSPNLAKERIAPSDKKIDTTLLYTYILYTFDGVEIAPDTITAFFDIYYGASDDSLPALGTLRLYHCESPNLPVELSRAERKALAGE